MGFIMVVLSWRLLTFSMILFLTADVEELKLVQAILVWFQICSSLKIIFLKSELMGVNVDHCQCVEFAVVLGL